MSGLTIHGSRGLKALDRAGYGFRRAVSLDEYYPARLEDIRRFGHAARKVRVRLKLPPFTKSFAQAVHGQGMANRENQRFPGKRRQEDWKYEDWMDEDDLLSGDLRQEQDMRIQLQ
jgi:hypothetical protein